MRIYTLTKTYTQESFSPMEVKTFVSKEKAHNEMIKQVFNYLQKCNFEVTMEELNSEYGYEKGDVCVGYDFASIGTSTMLWEIFVTEISLREVIIGNILSYIRETYKTPARFDDILYRLINEYKDEDLNAIASESDFVQEHIIGEALYENALAELGGKTDEVSYGKILEYLNESDQFIDVRCSLFNYLDLPIEEEKLEKWQRWFIGMLTICDGNKTMINLVREDIDDRQPKGEKIFVIERKYTIVAEHKNELPQNHRDLCSKLSDDQYFEIMANILTYKFKFGNARTFHDQMVHIYDEMKYIVFKVIKNYGVDVIYQNYGNIDIEDDKENGWNLVFVGEPCDIAHMIDKLKNQYNILF